MATEGTHTSASGSPSTREGEYAWAVATRFPLQGSWTESDYFELLDRSNKKGFELVDGRLEVLPLPTRIHQLLAGFLFVALNRFVEADGLGEVHFSGLRVRVRSGQIREPDVLFLATENLHHAHNDAFDFADLAMEVVSGDAKDRKRDYEDKTVDYAALGVSEYWIVDHHERVVIVNRFDGEGYAVAGRYTDGDTAASTLLDGFTIDVAALFKVADDVAE